MAEKRDYYDVLGTSKGASDSDIKKAYRKMAKQYHPDNNLGDKVAEEKMKEVNEAYEVLGDSDKKAKYDQFGHSAFDQSGGAGGYYGGGMDFDMGDIFSMFGFGGAGGARRNGPQRGNDLGVSVQIDFEEAIFGVTKEISISVTDTCDTCNGTGAKAGTHAETCSRCKGMGQERVVQQSIFGAITSVRTCSVCNGIGKTVKNPCTSCSGKGRLKKAKKFEVNIPKGIDNGQSIRLSGKGEAGLNGGGYGDLMLTVYVKTHDHFVRKGMDLYCEVPITFVQAALGDEIIIQTIDGEQKYTVKAGTQPETVVSIKGIGVPSIRNSSQRGSQVITFKVKIPTELTSKQKEILKEFGSVNVEPEKKRFWNKVKEKFEDA